MSDSSTFNRKYQFKILSPSFKKTIFMDVIFTYIQCHFNFPLYQKLFKIFLICINFHIGSHSDQKDT